MINTKQLFTTSLIGLCLMTTQAYSADDIQSNGSIPVQTAITSKQKLRSTALGTAEQQATKTVYLQRVTLSTAMRELIARRVAQQSEQKEILLTANDNSGETVELGMNEVPVLDQGQFGTCATFAATVAIDAYISKEPRNYISQMCNLELGAYLQKQNRRYPSGWDGSSTAIILKQMSDYGIIPTNSCPDPYPTYGIKDTGHPISISDFNQKHEMIMQSVPYSTLLVPGSKLNRDLNGEQTLQSVKTALRNGHRLVFGVLIPDDVDGDGASVNGLYQQIQAGWVLSPAIAKKLPRTRTGHAMVITGFNDNTVVSEVNHSGPKGGPNQDGTHKGVLILRNSWGSRVGLQGDYYMSYDYFKAAVTQLEEIG